jgi:hypothetical protein
MLFSVAFVISGWLYFWFLPTEPDVRQTFMAGGFQSCEELTAYAIRHHVRIFLNDQYCGDPTLESEDADR